MGVFLKIFFESISQATHQLTSNKLRSVLSLLGITIGIFCIIAVQTAADSLSISIKAGFSELGSDVLYIDKFPWNEDPEISSWKYAKRPEPDFDDYELIKERSKLASDVSFAVFTGGRTIKHESSSVEGAFIMGTTYEYPEILDANIEKGRYFTPNEYQSGANKVILGYEVADELFQRKEPIGKYVKLFGHKFQVIGVIEEEGDNVFNFIQYDDVIWLGFNSAKRFINVKDSQFVGKMLNAKARSGSSIEELKDELTGILRAGRKLKPKEDNNFALNELSLLNNLLDSVFGVINLAGFIIGIFALIVGIVSVANIMFVSVKERTNIIGIKKALGAKRYMILLEFLIEAVILCLIGGFVGLLLVYAAMKGVSNLLPFELFLTTGNIIKGIGWSVAVGMVSGLLPALLASRLDPVEAIRQ